MPHLFPYIQDDISLPAKHFVVKAGHFLQVQFLFDVPVVQVISIGGT
jgi:hypothetical protein